MKKLLKIITAIIICLSADFSLAQTVDSSFAGPHYLKQEAYFKALPVKRNAIVFLGNSITEVGRWSELFNAKNIVNRGISGDVTYGVLHRLPNILEQKPKKIFVTTGVNDIKRGASIEDVSRNYERIIKLITETSPRTKLYVHSILPVNEGMLAAIYAKITNERINKVNIFLQQLTIKYNFVYVDLHKSNLKSTIGELKTELTTDGLHLQPMAYIIWADYLKSLKYLK